MPDEARPIRVMIVDDTDHVRRMLASMLDLDGFDVVAEASGGDQAVGLAPVVNADVIVLDYAMPEVDGLTAARRIREAVPKQAIILYTAYVDPELEDEARKAGVALTVGKVDGIETLERRISELCLALGRG